MSENSDIKLLSFKYRIWHPIRDVHSKRKGVKHEYSDLSSAHHQHTVETPSLNWGTGRWITCSSLPRMAQAGDALVVTSQKSRTPESLLSATDQHLLQTLRIASRNLCRIYSGNIIPRQLLSKSALLQTLRYPTKSTTRRQQFRPVQPFVVKEPSECAPPTQSVPVAVLYSRCRDE